MRKLLLTTAAALMIAGAGVASAQTAGQSSQMPGQSGSAGQSGITGLGGSAGAQLGQAPWQASRLMGAQVSDSQGQQIGSISDFTISEDGQVKDVMLRAGGQSGQSGQLKVQFSELQYEQGSGFTSSKSAQELRQQSGSQQ